MAAKKNPIIIIILILGGIFLISKMDIQPQATQPLEPAKGQTIYLDFESGIQPCKITTIYDDNAYLDFPCVYSYKCGEAGCCASTPKVDNGNFVMPVCRDGSFGEFKINENLIGSDFKVFYTMIAHSFYPGTTGSVSGSTSLATNFGGGDSHISPGHGGSSKKGIITLKKTFLGEDYYIVNVAGREQELTIVDDFFPVLTVRGNGQVLIDEIRFSKPFTSCFSDENTALYVDRFVYPSTIRWAEPRTLAFEPIRFCFDFPTFRFVDGKFFGSDRERSELTRLLSQGGELPLKMGEEYWMFYLIPFVEGERERCPFGEAWSTWKDSCIETRFEEEIKLFQCETKSDCPVPPACEQEAVTCEANLCGYQGVQCKEEVLVRQEIIERVVNRTVPIFIGTKDFTFTSSRMDDDIIDSFNIGDKSITQNPFDSFSEPFLTRECTSNVKNETDWDMFCKYTIDTSFLRITDMEVFKDVLLNDDNFFDFEIHNDYTDFGSDEAGVIFDCVRFVGLQEDIPSETIGLAIEEGINLNTFKIKDDEMGEYICDLTPFIKITADKENVFPAEEKRVFTYNVVDELGVLEQVEPETIIVKETVIVKEEFKFSDIPTLVWIGLAFLIFIPFIKP